MSPPLSLRACAFVALTIAGYATRVAGAATPTDLAHLKDPNDFSQFVDLNTLDVDDLGLDNPRRRLLFIGDVHGMYDPLQRLLRKLSYNPKNDMLIHVGDIVAKGPESLSVLDWFSSRNITGVRGNHDQKVIEWRGWIDWVKSEKGGAKWLQKLERKYPDGFPSARSEKKKGKKKQPKKSERWPIPDGWEFNGDHYKIARGMTRGQADYLLRLPLTLHLEPLHAFVVHAGVLPMDPTQPPRARQQPLARVPNDGQRSTQELSVLSRVPQNMTPWNRINVRSITPEGEVSRSNSDGAPWSDIWNAILGSCVGFDSTDNLLVFNDGTDSERPLRLPCHPASVIYGHAASRGLDIKQWSKGLDTGCVSGKRLTIMALGSQHGLPRSAEPIEFGEAGSRAHLVSVTCPIDE